MSFEHSIIIPYKLYKRCNMESNDNSLDILTDETLPSDVKLKLYNQATIGTSSSPLSFSTPDPIIKRGEFILSNIPDKDKPVVRSILDIMDKNRSRTDYNDNLELILDSELLTGSNLVNVLLYLTRNLPITSDQDIPIGSRRLHQKLIELGMPTIWIKKAPVKRKARSPLQRKTKERAIRWSPL